MKTIIVASISLLSFITFTSSSPAPQTNAESSSSKSQFNLGVSSNRNNYELSGQNFGNLAQLADQKIQALNAINHKIAAGATPQNFNLLSQVQTLPVQPIQKPSFPDSGRKQAIQERESKPSMVDSLYGYAQQFVASLFNHKPIVDMIQEKDKYGNDGDKYRNIGVAVVNGFEGLSNFLNSAVEVPFTLMKQAAEKATTALNGVGGKLVSLQ